ncbi:MAG: hypothetical protein A3H98_11715 [Bacteroidetes bacterium RIFCSPLOWO2_02_FULL_36_8]|nr:MAG: hypothetical protein A3H98_11715 [Bacteroidetes bacterium RIFCSPLOWO2_02_FULL_36_8]OFY71562.1 MAG: hypothetical protein A3G23_04670 [Bacteroidetes bacterium RIFCSPLOWO2_12_FULL_37_12]
MYKQGDIVIVPFPFTNLLESKFRPAVVISTSEINKTNDIILAQITSKTYKDNFSFTIELDKLSSPLEKVSQVRCNKIFTLEKALIRKIVSSFDSVQKRYLLNKIRSFIEFES